MRRHPSSRRVVPLVLGFVALLAASCSGGSGAGSGGGAGPSATPVPAVTGSAPAGPSLADTRTLTPARRLFSVAVPNRFVDVPPGAPEANAVATVAKALQSGVGVLAVDRRTAAVSGSGYSPTVGGYCTTVPSQDLAGLGGEMRAAAVRTGTTAAPPKVEVLPALVPTAGPRVVVTYPGNFNGRLLDVMQIGGLAGPGRACVLTFSTEDPARDAETVRTVRDTFRMAG